ncbi:MAG: PIN domain-containing protein [Patescibacteria group bacterium]
MPKDPPLILFNASVILAGIKSPLGGSAKLLSWSKQGKVIGLVSEIIVDEALRNATRIHVKPQHINRHLKSLKVCYSPKAQTVAKFEKIVKDLGDAHVLASAEEEKAQFLVTLDKKHLLILQGEIKKFKIVSPGQLIEVLSSIQN